jgi:predicted enzyme related to lactoylglutathione lyase
MSAGWSVAPYFLVDNVVATAEFYRDKLGFHYDRFWGNPPAFCMVKRGGIIIMLSQVQGARKNPNSLAAPNEEPWDAYVWIDDADSLLSEYAANGVKIARTICDQPYLMRDFDIEDCNGYRLCFGHSIGS